MATGRKRCFKERPGEEAQDALIKQEMEWRPEDPHPTELSYPELDMKPLLSIKTEEDVSKTDASPYAAQPFTPGPQTPADDYEVTKTELTSDEEFMDEKNDSNSSCSSQTSSQRFLALPDDQESRVATASNESRTCEISTDTQTKEHCERAYKCELCPRSFGNKYLLKTHLITHAKDRERKFPCELCQRAFYHKGDLKSHMTTHTNETFKCEVCPQTFRSKFYLKVHLKTHAKDRERKFPCQSCKSAFYKKSDLTRHMRGHRGETFNCKVCGSPFTQKRNLDVHMLRLHKDVFISTELQLDAEKESGNNTEPSQQSTLHLGGEPQIRKKIPVGQSKASQQSKKSWTDCEQAYKCEFCERSFSRKFTLKVHLNSHAKDRGRKFPCPSCERVFYTNWELTRHMKTHSGKTFNCELCGASYKHKGSLDIHVLRLHTNELSRNELMLSEEEASVNYAQESQQSTLKLVEEQQARVNPEVTQIEAHKLSFTSHSRHLEVHLEKPHSCTDSRAVEDPTNLKEEFMSDEEFIDEKNS